MKRSHGSLPRGLSSTVQSPLAQGRFGRMFRHLPPAKYGANDAESLKNLGVLGENMVGLPPDDPSDGPDPEESGIPALYTYFGQFVDHDLTFDPVSVLTKAADPDGLIDFRTPAFDLDNLYGRGPGDQPYMYQDDGKRLALGEPLSGMGVSDARDLPRFNGHALIGDPRNDENTIVSQLQGLFQRFHNRLCHDHPKLDLPAIQRLTRFHYQYVILNDFLPRIIKDSVLQELKTNGRFDPHKLRFFHWHNFPFMPVEFSVAAYRLGHSMIRPGYRLNDDPKNLIAIFSKKKGDPSLAGFQPVVAGRAIDWDRFIDIGTRAYDGDDKAKQRRLQFAYRIDTSIVGELFHLPQVVVQDPPDSLALRNLERGFRLSLPSGQSVAKAMGVPVMLDEDIIIGKAVDKPETGDVKGPIVKVAGEAFAGNCPLWTYILAEASANQIKVDIPVSGAKKQLTTPQLGAVGGRIVAEVFLGILFGDHSSLLSQDPSWHPSNPNFKLKDIVSYALGDGLK
jgi:hypothetical protein